MRWRRIRSRRKRTSNPNGWWRMWKARAALGVLRRFCSVVSWGFSGVLICFNGIFREWYYNVLYTISYHIQHSHGNHGQFEKKEVSHRRKWVVSLSNGAKLHQRLPEDSWTTGPSSMEIVWTRCCDAMPSECRLYSYSDPMWPMVVAEICYP